MNTRHIFHVCITLNGCDFPCEQKRNIKSARYMHIYLEKVTKVYYTATNPSPSSHIPMGQNFMFLVFETKIQKTGNAMR